MHPLKIRAMTRCVWTVSCAVLFFALAVPHAFSQQKKGTIEESWNRAGSDQKPVLRKQKQPEQQFRRVDTSGSWKRSKAAGTKPWLRKTPPVAGDLYTRNAVLIDSLSRLYCLPQSYIRSLTARNNAGKADQPSAPPKKDFDYKSDPNRRPAEGSGGGALQQLNRELDQLLEQCLKRN